MSWGRRTAASTRCLRRFSLTARAGLRRPTWVSKKERMRYGMKSTTCYRATSRLAALCLLLLPSYLAQGSGVVTVAPLEKARVKRNDVFTVKMSVQVKPGFHVNSNAPEDEYLIPLKLTWTG